MVRDFVTLLNVEGRRGKASVIQWLGLFGFDPHGSLLYHLYFWLFWLFWLVTMWSFAVEQVYQLSTGLPAQTPSRLFGIVPVVILILQLLYLAAVLREEPLKLAEPTLAYVAFSPINRASIVILEFVRALLLPAVFAAIISCWLAMLLTWRAAPDNVGIVGLGASLAAVLLVYFSAALVWALALWKIQFRQLWVRRIFWLVLPAATLVAGLAPAVILFPGHIWQQAANLSLSVADGIGFMTGFGAALACLLVVGNRVNMSVIAEASQISLRIHRLGPFGRLYATDLIQQIQQQTRLAHAKRPSVKLSRQVTGYGVLWNRASVSLRRLLPGSVLQPLAVGSSLTMMITTIVRIGGWRSIQSWILVLLVLCVIRLKSVLPVFRQDVTQPFLRQMIPLNNLALFLTDTAYLLLLAITGSVTVIALQPWDTPLAVMLLGLLGVTALGMGQALEMVEERLIIHRRIPFEYTVVIGGGAVIALGAVFHSLWAATGALVLINILLGFLLYRSRT